MEVIRNFIMEAARVAILALISWLLTGVVITSIVASTLGTYLSPEIQILIVTGILTVLKSIDRALHESSPKNDAWLGERGITGF